MFCSRFLFGELVPPRILGRLLLRVLSVPPKHSRSIAENMMHRLKQLRGDPHSRTFERQVNEARVRAAILNTFTQLCAPQSLRVGQVASAA
jgi:hypothetical protein